MAAELKHGRCLRIGVGDDHTRRLKPYLYVLPALIVICVFGFVAMGISLWISLTRYDLVAGSHGFVGLANYREALSGQDSFFRVAFLNTFYYVVLARCQPR